MAGLVTVACPKCGRAITLRKGGGWTPARKRCGYRLTPAEWRALNDEARAREK